jgi:hypothetical protein
LGIIYISRDQLRIAETFPELAVVDPRRWLTAMRQKWRA